MKKLFLEMFKGLLLGVCFVLFCFVIASLSRSVYSNTVHPHGESVLTDCKDNIGAQSERAFFVRNISMRSHVMAELERDTFECAGFLCHQSVNPFQLCHHYLTVIGKASKQSLGAHNHA